MRKILCVLTVLVLCLTLAAPVFATQESTFVPSITYKPNPELVEVPGADGKYHAGVIRDLDGNIIDYIDLGCLRLTPIAHIWDPEEREKTPIEVINLLEYLYEELNSGRMTIPYEKHTAKTLKAENMAIRDLFDARWYCEDHPIMLAPEGVVLELIFDLGVVEDVELFVQTFDEISKDWEPVVSVTNNGDGTVTVVFEHLCGIEFSMEIEPEEEPARSNILWWILLLVIALLILLFVIFKKKKDEDEEEETTEGGNAANNRG